MIAGPDPDTADAAKVPAKVRAATLNLVVQIAFLHLAEGRGCSPTLELTRLRSFDALDAALTRVQAERGGQLLAPARLDGLRALGSRDRDALVAVAIDELERLRGAEVEALGELFETLRSGAARRRDGTHYTPRDLARTLVADGLALHGDEAAQVQVCDPSVGSGGVLLAACRALAPEPEARLGVALTQLLGVDEDPEALELAKLSLWLECRASALRLDCFDHALVCGDFLLGLDPEAAKLDASPRLAACLAPCRAAGARYLADLARLGGDPSPAAALARSRARAQFEASVAPAQAEADAVLAVFLSATTDAERRAVRARLDRQGQDRPPARPRPVLGATSLHPWLRLPQLDPNSRPPSRSIAFIGNPPFLGKNGLVAARGRAYLDWLKRLHPGAHGNADYAAHFFRRAATLVGARGSLSFVATNTIAQGDTRASGLAPLVRAGARIHQATRNLEWPGPAKVTVSVVHLVIGPGLGGAPSRLDGAQVPAIDSRLRSGRERPDPPRQPGPRRAFIGTYLHGRGFVLDAQTRAALIAADPRNAGRIRLYLSGDQLNRSPTQTPSRFAVDLGGRSLAEARAWPTLVEHLERQVRPQRARLADNSDGRRRKHYWWQHGRVTPGLDAALVPLSRCLVASLVSKHLSFAFAPATWLFSHKLCVFALDTYADLAVLQSRIHGTWAWLLSSTMRNAGINYSPSDCFETFPWPRPEANAAAALERAGAGLDQARTRFMRDAKLGLTKTYDALADLDDTRPALVALRERHDLADQAVLAAYGWTDLALPPRAAGPSTRAAFEEALLDRLFDLGADRAVQFEG